MSDVPENTNFCSGFLYGLMHKHATEITDSYIEISGPEGERAIRADLTDRQNPDLKLYEEQIYKGRVSFDCSISIIEDLFDVLVRRWIYRRPSLRTSGMTDVEESWYARDN